ncbi:MAG: hypothetical protein FVQ83_14925 [Chloroflexi bacterium]|nr:hypothetical protein [Chloroflexota bacterium]
MTEKLESGAREPEADKQTQEQVSAISGDQQTSNTANSPEQPLTPEFEQHLEAHIAAEVERRFQSAKDKRWTQLERQFGTLSDFQQTLDEVSEGKTAKQGSAEDVEKWLENKMQALLATSGLENDPEIQTMLHSGDYAPDVEGYMNMLGDITELALRRSQRPKASAATVTQPSGGGLVEPDLQGEYDLRKKRLRPGDVNSLLELKREFRQKGLDVY